MLPSIGRLLVMVAPGVGLAALIWGQLKVTGVAAAVLPRTLRTAEVAELDDSALDRALAAAPFSTRAEDGQPVPGSDATSLSRVPAQGLPLRLVGVLLGHPTLALLDGVPGATVPRLVTVGDTVIGGRIIAVSAEGLRIQIGTTTRELLLGAVP